MWEATATRIKVWLKEQQRGLLKDKDISRLDVDGHRIKDPARTLAKLAEKVAAEPDVTVTSAIDVEDQIRDIVMAEDELRANGLPTDAEGMQRL